MTAQGMTLRAVGWLWRRTAESVRWFFRLPVIRLFFPVLAGLVLLGLIFEGLGQLFALVRTWLGPYQAELLLVGILLLYVLAPLVAVWLVVRVARHAWTGTWSRAAQLRARAERRLRLAIIREKRRLAELQRRQKRGGERTPEAEQEPPNGEFAPGIPQEQAFDDLGDPEPASEPDPLNLEELKAALRQQIVDEQTDQEHAAIERQEDEIRRLAELRRRQRGRGPNPDDPPDRS